MPVLMTTVAETNKIDCFLMGDSSSLALLGETPRELVQFRRGSFGWGTAHDQQHRGDNKQ